MKKGYKKFFLIALLITCFKIGYGEDLSVEELYNLKEKGLLTQEDYNNLLADINGTLENEQLYKLTVNGVLIDDKFKVKSKGKTLYFPLFEFIDTLGFFDQKQEVNLITISLKSGFSVKIDKATKLITLPNNKEFNKRVKLSKDWLMEDKGEFFIEEGVFKEIFLRSLFSDSQYTSVRMQLGFNTPEEAAILFKVRQEEVLKELNQNEIIYVNERKIFEVGNARLQLYQNFDKEAGEDKYRKDWEGSLEYQGAFLYGDLNTSYDFKEKTLGDIELRYKNIFFDHELTLGAYSTANDSREFGLTFRKDKGYYELGKKFVISENVPIGSKVELIYMGYTVETKDAENGKVVFDNPVIRSNRSYVLKIYSPNGDIETRYINTAQNYNQQNKGEVEYDITLREDKTSSKYKWDANMYYGLTQELTLGLGSKRTPEKRKDKYEFLDEGRMELTYSNNITNSQFPVTLRFGNDRTFTSGLDNSGKEYDERYEYDGLLEVGIYDWRLKTEAENYGKYYDEKNINRYEVEYGGFRNFTFGYEYEKTKYRNRKDESENKYKINYDKGITNNLLLSSEVIISDKDKEEYRADLYYTGFSRFNVNWRNTWKEKISDYETELEITNNNFYDLFDYSLGIAYSEKYKERFTVNFTFDYDNFLKITGRGGDRGSRHLKVGIDRVIDLKDIRRPVEDIDSSRVKVIAFIDENDNNSYDEGEERVDNVEIKIRDQRQITDENGEAMFYGIPNDTLIDLSPTIRKPSYSMGNNIIKIKGRASSTIDVYIPVKPMLTLSGTVELEEGLNIPKDELQQLYNDILIKVKDSKGKEIELTMPDENGNFIVSGIFPDDYYLEVKYLGTRYDIPELKEQVELVYNGNSATKLVINIGKNRFSLNKSIEGNSIGGNS
ncbi:hypothetical protein [Fusobacterium sp.]|uniref:hypothetical protein n=1 Tax=Fusobacterium sp. TaxID=68766 RepID=UPI00260BE4C9|nr:hypothetical protein [Fusobacterium sp.]